jgi:hypothetical protein
VTKAAVAATDSKHPDDADGLWRRPKRYGYGETLRGLGGVVAPLLAGFSLATIAALVSADNPPPLADWAVLALALAMSLLLFAMQVAFLALARTPSPAEILNWRPEVTVDEAILQDARSRQAADFEEMSRLWKLTSYAYDFGVIAFLAALVLLLVPDDWSAPRIAAVVVAGASLATESWWAVANIKRSIPHPVVRTPLREPAPELDAVARDSILRS